MPRTSSDVLMIAVRKPVAGRTKTRLGAAIGHENASLIYRAFLQDLAERFQSVPLPYDVVWAHTPESAPFEDVVRDLLPGFVGDVKCIEQCGPDWMTRQDRLMRWAANAGYERSLLTASDSPHMSQAMIMEGFAALAQTPLALGRVHDGGYYLLGMKGYIDILKHVPMSTSNTSQTFLEVARSSGQAITEVTPTFDVDIVDDLEALEAALAVDPNAASATRRALEYWRRTARL